MSPRSRRVLAATAPLLVAATAATPAHAAAIQGPPCAIFEQYGIRNVPIAGGGFAPGELVRVEYVARNGKVSGAGSAVTDAAGGFRIAAFPAIFNTFGTQDQEFTLRATQSSGAVAVFPYRQVRPLTLAPSRITDVRKRIRYTARGLPTGRTIYVHFRLRGRTLGRVALGKATGPCGIVSRRIKAVPVVRAGTWNLQFDASRRYSRSTRPRVTTKFTVARTFR